MRRSDARAPLVLGNTATTATSTLQIAGTLNFAATTTVTSTFAGTAPAQVGHILVGGTFEKPQDRGAAAHDQHGADEQQPTAAVDRPALLRDESYGAENNGKPACSNVNR